MKKDGIVKEPTNVEIFDPNDPEEDLKKKKKIPHPDPRMIYIMETIYDNPDMYYRQAICLTLVVSHKFLAALKQHQRSRKFQQG